MSWTQTAEAKYSSGWDCYVVHGNNVYVSDAAFTIYLAEDDDRMPVLDFKWKNWLSQKYHIVGFAEGGCSGDFSAERGEANRQRHLDDLKSQYPQATFITVHWVPN